MSDGALPVFIARITAGFPSPAADYEEGKLDLNKHLFKNPAVTFFVRVAGDSMLGAGIHDGVASEGIQKPWQTQFDHRSACYTTRWDELVKAK